MNVCFRGGAVGCPSAPRNIPNFHRDGSTVKLMIAYPDKNSINAPKIEGFTPLNRNEDTRYQAWRNAVYEELEAADMCLVANDWLNCSTSFATFDLSPSQVDLPANVKSVYVCNDAPEHYAKATCFTCHCRACPDCARRETARLLSRYMPLVDALSKKHSQKFTFKHIILTTPIELTDANCQVEVNRLLAAVIETFNMLLPDDWRKKQGFIVTTEFGEDGHKLHFHVFFYGQFIKQMHLSDTWNWCNGGIGKIVHIRMVHGGKESDALAEQVKYVTKFWSRDKETGEISYFSPHLIPVLLKVLAGVRRVRSYGIFYKVQKTQSSSKCPHCEASLTRWNPIEWSIFAQTGWTPDEQREQLHLKPGNNFFLLPQERDKSSPESVPKQEQLWTLYQPH